MIIVKTKKSLLALALIGFLSLMFGTSLRFISKRNTFFTKVHNITVIVDAGHGLPDGGAVGYAGTVEQEVNLKVAKKISEMLESYGFDIILTREEEKSLAFDEDSTIRQMKVTDMKMRREIIDKSNADLFISVHMNSFPDKSVSGIGFFYSKNHSEVLELAEKMQNNVGAVTGAKMQAVKPASDTLYLMKNIPVPAILAECGFLSNPSEEEKLNDDEYISKIAWAIADAITEYFG